MDTMCALCEVQTELIIIIIIIVVIIVVVVVVVVIIIIIIQDLAEPSKDCD
jgi:hypothetical protein